MVKTPLELGRIRCAAAGEPLRLAGFSRKVSMLISILALPYCLGSPLARGDEPAQHPAPKRWVSVHDNGHVQLGKVIYNDASGTPALDQPLAEFSMYEVVAPGGGTPACGEESCFEDYGSPYDAELSLYVFAVRKVAGQRYAKVRFRNRWAWVLLPDGVATWQLEQHEIECYIQRQREMDPGNTRSPELLPVKMNSPLTVTEKLSVTGGHWVKQIRLEAPGMLTFSLPRDSGDHYISLAAVSLSKSSSKPLSKSESDLYSVSRPITADEPFQTPLSAGLYQIKLEEWNSEGDAGPSCPSRQQTLTVALSPLPSDTQGAVQGASLDPLQPLTVGPQPYVHRAMLTRAFPTVTFSGDLESITLITVENVRRPSGAEIKAEYGQGSSVYIEGDHQRILTGPGKALVRVSLRDTDDMTYTEIIPVSFSVSAAAGAKASDRLFEPTWNSDMSFPSSKVEFRNVSGLDLSEVALYFDYLHELGHFKGTHTVPLWSNDAAHHFDFFYDLPKEDIRGMYRLILAVKSVNGTSAIDSSLANPSFANFTLPKNPDFLAIVPSPEYEKKIKLRVFDYCGRQHPTYDDAFYTCQNRWLKEEFSCRRAVDPRRPEFITCVQEGIAKSFPELFRHLASE